MTRIAIIGAGLAGLTLARELRAHGDVTVFEKSGGYGGRMATRYASPWDFDHGAQFFRAKSAEFYTELQQWAADGIIAPWRARYAELDRNRVIDTRDWSDDHPHYVATPRMNALGKYLAEGTDVRLRTRIAELQRPNGAWLLKSAAGETFGSFDWVIVTAPASQSAALLPPDFAHIDAVRDSLMLGCCAVMLGFDTPLQLDWDAALVHNADISWVSVNSSKPGRPDAPALLVHSTNRYADASEQDDPDGVLEHLLAEVRSVTGVDVSTASHTAMHRWRYANAPRQKLRGPLLDSGLQLAACGDWCSHGRVEAAYLEAVRLCRALVDREML